MKILMLGKIGIFKNGGGDWIQIKNTADELTRMGVLVDIKDNWILDYSLYDLVHVFQLDWTVEPYFYTQKAKEADLPVVLSPIHHNIQKVKKFDDEYAFDFRRISRILFKDQFKRDTFKNVYRSMFNPKMAKSVFASVKMGLKKMHIEALKNSDVVLVQTRKEAHDLMETYGVCVEWEVIPNGVGKNFLEVKVDESPFDFENYILCVGRIEPRKNQLRVIEAVKKFRDETNIDIKLVFVGKMNAGKHFEYNYRFSALLEKNPWILHVESVSYDKMPAYYKFAKVGVSASWFETTGLTSLEALFCGTNAVASGARAYEYLGDLAFYCFPDNVESIKEAIKSAYFSPRPVITDQMKNEYTWTNAAEKTLAVYKKLLAK